jgi:hypothetical protein
MFEAIKLLITLVMKIEINPKLHALLTISSASGQILTN